MPRSWIFFQFFFPWYPSSANPLSWVSQGKKNRGWAARKFVDYSTTSIHFHRSPFVPPRQQSSSCTDFHGWGFVAHLDRTARTASRFIVTQEYCGFYGGSRCGFDETLHSVDVASQEWWSAANALLRLLRFEIRAFFLSARFLVSISFIWFLGKREAIIPGNDCEFVFLRKDVHWVISIISLTTSATDFPYVGMYEMRFSLECFPFSPELFLSVLPSM
jgi:hypothetical protein